MTPFKKILVPIDFGEATQDVLAAAVALAKRDDAEITLVHVWELPAYAYATLEYSPGDLFTPVQKAARAQLDDVLQRLKADVPRAVGILRSGSPWREILATIEETKPDLVVMATHGRRGVPRMVLGSVAEKVVRMSPAPVLSFHASTEPR
jgi:nucleotide-binding universal stress UspA family protein